MLGAVKVMPVVKHINKNHMKGVLKSSDVHTVIIWALSSAGKLEAFGSTLNIPWRACRETDFTI